MKKLQKFLLFGALALLASCAMEMENGGDNGGGGGGVTAPTIDTQVTVLIPGGFGVVNTRALTDAQESEIKNATILVFSTADQLEQIVTVNSGGITNTAGAAGTSPRASLPVTLPSGNHNLVVIANGGGLVEEILGTDVEAIENKSYSAVVAQLVKPLEDKLFASGGPIPMWGESGVVLVNNTLADSPIASLKRAVARLDIGVGQFEDGAWTGLDMAGKTVPFTLREVYVMRPNDAFSLVPAASDVTRGEPTVPTSSKFSAEQSKTTFKYSGSGTITSGAGTSYTERSIYVPESDTHVTPDGTVGDLNHTERMALVLGGGYDGSAATTYYRVDFADGLELLDVLRNHLYRFEISSVSGPGFGDVVEAYNGGTSNMTAHIVDWNETPIEDIRFVGDKFVSLSKNPVVLVAAAEETYTVIIRTNIPEISFKPEGSANFLPIVSSDPIGRTLTGEALGLLYEFKKTAQGEYTLTITTKYANFGPGGADKVWDWTINAGPDVIEMPLEIRQLWSATDPTPYTVTLTASDPSLGSLTSSPAASSGVAKAKEGDVVKVLASPNSGSLFAGWEVRRTQPGGSSVIAIDNPLTNPLVLEMPAGDVEFVATFVDATAKIDSPSAPFLIYFSGEGADRTLQIGAWDNNKVKQSTLAFFHFGSVVGFDLENASDTWDSTDVLFNPTDIDPATAWNTGDANGYGKIPNFGNWLTATGTTYNAATHRDVENFVSTAAYHNAEYVPQGYGDPCKLVGLTVDQIRAGVVDNGQWRLPTARENILFAGAQNHANYLDGWAPGEANFSLNQRSPGNGTTTLNFWDAAGDTSAKGIDGGYFPGSTTSSLNTSGSFLPAAGFRDANGTTYYVGTFGRIWSSSVANNSDGHATILSENNVMATNNPYAWGYAVRCVPASSEGFSVKVDSQAGGSALANTDMAQPGTEVKAQATASVGSLFAGWRVVSPVGLTVDASANPLTFTMPTGAVILEANFVPAEVEVNGTVWYGANLAEKGVFATSAVEYGALFQWGRDTALDYVSSSTDGWLPDPVADDATWAGPNGTKGYTDPCPVGWRLPTRQEMADLIDTEYVSKLWVTGRNTVFGTGLRISPNEDSSKLIILPNAGGRDNNNGGAYYRGSFVHYWTSTPAESSTTSAYYLRVYNEITNGSANGTIGKARALSLRCVKDTPKLFNIEVSSADGGTAMANSREVLTGTNVTLQASPSVGMLFAGWEVLAGGSGTPMTIAGLDASKNPVTFTMPAADVSVKAHFLPAEVEVNGTIWAGANVDTPHKFAASAVDYGRLYQFGGGIDPAYANIGWPGAGNTADISASNPGITATGAPVTSFYISSPIWTAAEWPVDPAFNPCPAGWRPPTKNEITALLDANFNTNLKGWVQNYNGGNRNGLLVENNAGDRLFLPTSGYRTSASGTLTSAQFGWYRSITPNEGIMTSILYFERNVAVSSALSDVAAAAIRCVKATSTGALDLTTEAVLSDGTGGGGSIVVDNPEPTSGSEVKMLATPESGSFLFAGWRIVSAPDGFSLDAAANPVTFTMPAGGVSVEALFLPSEVEINGTVWAGSNLAAAGVFADSAVDYGALFQWGRNVALEYVSGTSGGWNVTAAANDQWIEGARGPADPCPIGWRVPTKAEYDDLYNTTHAAVSKPWSDVEGIGTLEFTSTDGKTLTFTDAGYRDLNGAIRYRGVSGNYWNATLSGTNASHLNFNSSYVNGTVARYAQKVYANAVRCVRHDSYAVAAMATSVPGTTNNTGGTASVTSDPEGTKPITGAGAGQSIYFSATPAAGYLWGGWEVVGTLPDGFTFDPTAQSLTITMPAGAVELRAVFVDATAKIATPVAPYLVYFEGTGANTRLQLGAWDNDKVKQSTMAFFQFGSLVGFQNNNDAWNSSRVLFNPTTTPESTWNTGDAAGYGAIPNFGSWLTANGGYVEGTHRTDNFISNTTSYATSANAKLGYGDPCRLIGLTADQVRAGVAGNDQWRMATTKENILFAGAQNHTSAATWAPGKTYFYLSQSATPNGTTSLNYYDATTTAKGIQGGYFPGTTTSTLNTAEAFLPAAGSRNTTGATSSVGTYGNFWSSSVYNTSNGHSLGFSGSNVSPASSNNYANGYAVRCVSTAEYFVLTLPTTGGTYKLTTVTTNGTALGSSTGGSPIRTSATGSGVSFEAVPATNYAFLGWSVNGELPAGFTFTEEQLRQNPLNFVMPAGEVYLQAVFVDTEPQVTTPTAPYLVYFEGTGANTRLQLGAWDNNKVKQSTMAFFQFGSLVGFDIENLSDTWDSTDVLFNPTATAESTWNAASSAGYGAIPNWSNWFTSTGTTYSDATHRTDNYISNTTSYATGANAKNGYGDPCKLIGFTAAQLKAMTAAQIQTAINNAKWRLATAKENILFTGAQNHASAAGWVPGGANFYLTQSATPNGTSSLNFWDASADATKGIVGAYFPGSTTTDLNTSGAFLPAAGYRNSNGDIPASSIGFVGNLWSSSVQTNLAGYKPGYSSANGVYPTDYAMSLTAAGVRCVSTASYSMTAQVTITSGSVTGTGGNVSITTVASNGTILGTSTIITSGSRNSAAGSGVSLKANPATDYVFSHWEVGSGPAGFSLSEEQKNANPLNIVMPAGNVVLRAVFGPSFVPHPEGEVLINGVYWAMTSLSDNGVFSINPPYDVAYFQWGKNRPIGREESVTWSSLGGAAANGQWLEGSHGPADPCPSGWRLPTRADYDAIMDTTLSMESLEGEPHFWIYADDGILVFGSDSSADLDPAGYRDHTGSLLNDSGRGNEGIYFWTASTVGSMGLALEVSENTGWYLNPTNYEKLAAMPVRCVHD